MTAEDDEPVLPLWTLVQTAHVVAGRFRALFAEAGLTPAQFGVLASLVDGDDVTQADLARITLVRPQSMGRLVNAMVDQGLIVRDGPGGRGRRAGLSLTPAGRRAVEAARPRVYAINRPEAIGLDEASVTALVAYLDAIKAVVGGVEP